MGGLELYQWKNYVGTDCKVSYKGMDGQWGTAYLIGAQTYRGKPKIVIQLSGGLRVKRDLDEVKPILYRIKDINLKIEVDGNPLLPEMNIINYIHEELRWECLSIEDGDLNFEDLGRYLPLEVMQEILNRFYSWGYWVGDQSYFSEGLILDKNKI